jgi:hypothetical protein
VPQSIQTVNTIGRPRRQALAILHFKTLDWTGSYTIPTPRTFFPIYYRYKHPPDLLNNISIYFLFFTFTSNLKHCISEASTTLTDGITLDLKPIDLHP